MYAWIWRKLPFGLPGKFIGTFVLLSVIGALLWYQVFPWAEPLLPFDDVQVGDPADGYSDTSDPTGELSPSPGASPGDGHDLPYATTSATPNAG
jgi:hypothetical protein